MKFIIFLSAFVLIVFLYYQVTKYVFFLHINDTNILSNKLEFLFDVSNLNILFLLSFIILLVGFFSTKIYLNCLAYTYALLILNMAWLITANMLALKSNTSCYFFTIYHPIPLQVKEHFLQLQLSAYSENLRLDNHSIKLLTDSVQEMKNQNLLYMMDAESITEFANKILYDAINHIDNLITKGEDPIIESTPVDNSPSKIRSLGKTLLLISLGVCLAFTVHSYTPIIITKINNLIHD